MGSARFYRENLFVLAVRDIRQIGVDIARRDTGRQNQHCSKRFLHNNIQPSDSFRAQNKYSHPSDRREPYNTAQSAEHRAYRRNRTKYCPRAAQRLPFLRAWCQPRVLQKSR